MSRILFFVIGLFFVNNLYAAEVITIESTITGSKEQPKVTSIVPWQQPKDPEYIEPDVSDLGGGNVSFDQLDRDTFKLEVNYISAMRKGAAE